MTDGAASFRSSAALAAGDAVREERRETGTRRVTVSAWGKFLCFSRNAFLLHRTNNKQLLNWKACKILLFPFIHTLRGASEAPPPPPLLPLPSQPHTLFPLFVSTPSSVPFIFLCSPTLSFRCAVNKIYHIPYTISMLGRCLGGHAVCGPRGDRDRGRISLSLTINFKLFSYLFYAKIAFFVKIWISILIYLYRLRKTLPIFNFNFFKDF